MEVALAGKTNSGKSSFFKAATMIDVEISNRPFVTIKPNEGVAYLTTECVEKEFGIKCKPKTGFCKNGTRFVPIKLWDIAGLVPGAHEGRGLGLQFLDDIRQASVLLHIVDFSGMTDSEGMPTENHNPEDDIQFVENEINLWFVDVIKRNLEKIKKLPPGKAELMDVLQQQLSGLGVTKEQISQTLDKYAISDVESFAKGLRQISKPILTVANKMDLKKSQENFEKLSQKHPNIVPASAESEIALKKAGEKKLINYTSGNGFEIVGELDDIKRNALEMIKREVIDKYGSTGVQNVLNKAVFEILNYIIVYPVADASKLTDKDGNYLPDAFLVPNGTTMKEFAFRVHTQLGEKFITGIDARTKLRLSADYKLKNRDVVSIVFGK
ncbi:MAG: redox-regulated ATPase YchF [Candidatus Aenigmarchaeota archaeon]|nr:redox-regulated ATPase YchF [Candidatus Aenigmarchaeota archaeon]